DRLRVQAPGLVGAVRCLSARAQWVHHLYERALCASSAATTVFFAKCLEPCTIPKRPCGNLPIVWHSATATTLTTTFFPLGYRRAATPICCSCRRDRCPLDCFHLHAM